MNRTNLGKIVLFHLPLYNLSFHESRAGSSEEAIEKGWCADLPLMFCSLCFLMDPMITCQWIVAPMLSCMIPMVGEFSYWRLQCSNWFLLVPSWYKNRQHRTREDIKKNCIYMSELLKQHKIKNRPNLQNPVFYDCE